MPPTPEKDTHGIPLSQYLPVSLERPLKLFGETFSVFISTTLTLSPHTVLESAYGASGLQLARMQKERLDRALNALWRANSPASPWRSFKRIRLYKIIAQIHMTEGHAIAFDFCCANCLLYCNRADVRDPA